MFNYDKMEKLIADSGKTKTYLCKKMGKPVYYLRDVVKQRTSIPQELQVILAEELGTTVAFLNDEDEKSPSPVGDELDETTRAIFAEIDSMESDEDKLLALEMIRAIKRRRAEK